MLHLPQQVLLVINVASRKTGITNEQNARVSLVSFD